MATCRTTCSRLAWLGLCIVTMGQSGPCGQVDSRPSERSAPVTLGGNVDVADFSLPAGQTTMVTSDLVLNSAGDVIIDGQLVGASSGGAGFSITINATGNVQIGGVIQAGDGSPAGAATVPAPNARGDAKPNARNPGEGEDGQAGGSIQIITSGNLTVVDGATVHAGNGTSGTGGTIGGAGGNGGHVVLCAGGALTMKGAVHIGDGGNGGDATPIGVNSAPSQSENRGGDSGFLYVNAASYDWRGFNNVDLSLDPAANGLASGGLGGNAGRVTITDDLMACAGIELPVTTMKGSRRAQDGGTIVGTVYRIRRATRGGHGWWVGGMGGSITLVACSHEDRDGSNWSAQAGNGGNVTRRQPDTTLGCVPWPIVLVGAIGGSGGLASSTVAAGMLGDEFSPNGGKGGSAEAIGGNGGNGEFFSGQTGGPGGNAVASGGFGGAGFSRTCDNRGAGGRGGDGGEGDAQGGNGGDGVIPGKGGQGTALGNGPLDVASRGGDGGEGVPGGGLGGTGGQLTSTTGADGAASPNSIVGSIERRSKAPDGQMGPSFDPAGCQD